MMMRLGLAVTFLSILGVAGCGDTTAPAPKIVAPAEPHIAPDEPSDASAEAPVMAPPHVAAGGSAEEDAASRARSLPLGKQQELFDATNQLTQGKELTAAQLKLLREFRGLAGIDESLKIYEQRHPEAAAESNEPESDGDASAPAATPPAEPGDDDKADSPAADAAKSAPASAPETNDGKSDSGE